MVYNPICNGCAMGKMRKRCGVLPVAPMLQIQQKARLGLVCYIRNCWKGIVKSVSHGNIVSEIVLEISPGVEVVSAISRHSAEKLKLAVGQQAHALVKSSEVSIGVE